jgi:AcrR family transcriptional regulator
MRSPSPAADDTRELLIDTAERLFADHGIEGVSLRQIGATAGQRNTGAVKYHFGDRDGLVRAIFESRLPRINQHRRALLNAIDEGVRPESTDALVTAYAEPLVHELQRGRYVGFLNRLSHYARRSHPMRSLDPLMINTADEVLGRLARRVPHPNQRVRRNRVALVAEFVIAALDNEQVRAETTTHRSARVTSPDEFFTELFGLATVMIEARVHPGANGSEPQPALPGFRPSPR